MYLFRERSTTSAGRCLGVSVVLALSTNVVTYLITYLITYLKRRSVSLFSASITSLLTYNSGPVTHLLADLRGNHEQVKQSVDAAVGVGEPRQRIQQ